MRARAQALGCKLELTRVDPAVVLGSEHLLREALLELLENACRYGSPAEPVRLSVLGNEREAVLEVVNPAGRDGPTEERRGTSGSGLGLQVVQWIASEHGGRLVHGRTHNQVTSALHLPLADLKALPAPTERTAAW
jgi:signal transduction histidine kinase